MIYHQDLGQSYAALRTLKKLIDQGEIQWGGNKNLKIYGTLSCKSGKRMKQSNRVFFQSEAEALTQGYRPCGHCMPVAYKAWKAHQESERQR